MIQFTLQCRNDTQREDRDSHFKFRFRCHTGNLNVSLQRTGHRRVQLLPLSTACLTFAMTVLRWQSATDEKEAAVELSSAVFWSPSGCVTPHFSLHPPLWLALGSHPRLWHILETWAMLMWGISDNNHFRHPASPSLWLLHVPVRDTGSTTWGKPPLSAEHHCNTLTKRKRFRQPTPTIYVLQSHPAKWKSGQRSKWRHIHQKPFPSEASATRFSSTWKMNSISQLSTPLPVY